MAIEIDLNEFTLGDAEDFEEVTGVRFSDVYSNRTAPVLTALVWIVKRRKNPDYTLDDARKEAVIGVS